MAFDTSISRNSTLVPAKLASQIISELPEASFVLNHAKKVTMPQHTVTMPVASVNPSAYWVTGDSGLKQTSSAEWLGVNLVAEELAVIVPIPDAYADDAASSGFDLMGEIRPKIVEAIGRAIDGAALFGTNKPASWSPSIYSGTLASGNVKVHGSDDYAKDVSDLGVLLAQDGFSLDGFASRPGFMWTLTGMRSATDKLPIFQPDLTGRPGGRLYGYDFREVTNGAWDSSEAELIAGDWSKAIVGIRQDITFKVFDQGVISDSEGAIVHNLMQQDAKALRVVMRVAFATVNPVTALNAVEGSRYPFATLQASSANS